MQLNTATGPLTDRTVPLWKLEKSTHPLSAGYRAFGLVNGGHGLRSTGQCWILVPYSSLNWASFN
jgi:hypothetical protein